MLDFYGLKEKLFSLLPNPRFIYLSQPYLETKAKLLYFLAGSPGVAAQDAGLRSDSNEG